MTDSTATLDTNNVADYLADLNPEQLKAASASRHESVKVMAGAGTGKTELIARRFTKLVDEMIQDDVPRPTERILVVTFTEDAARSMAGRIRNYLGALPYDIKPDSDDLWVSTFHAFANRILREYAFLVGLTPDFTLISKKIHQRVLINRIIESVKQNEFADLTQILQDAGFSSSENNASSEGIPANILDVDQLNQNPHLDNTLIDRLLHPDTLLNFIGQIKTNGLTPKTFYDTALKQTQAFHHTILSTPTQQNTNLPPTDQMIDYIEQWQTHFKDYAHSSWQPQQDITSESRIADIKKDVAPFGSTFLGTANQAKGCPAKPADFEQLDTMLPTELEALKLLAALYALYQDTLLKQNACEFDDLMNLVVHILETRPEIKMRLQNRFEAIIVDEFQDSNGSQLKLLDMLIRSDKPNITVVGDEKQSIYGFRFAEPENMDLVFTDQQTQQARAHQEISLQTNYRSMPPVLTAANIVTRDLTHDESQCLHPRLSYQEELSKGKTHPNVTWVNLDHGELNPKTNNIKTEPIEDARAREMHYIASEIQRLHNEHTIPYNNIAVLAHTHPKCKAIQQCLNTYGIPSLRKKDVGFFQKPLILQTLSLLKICLDLSHDTALVHILSEKLSPAQLKTLADTRSELNHINRSHSVQTHEQNRHTALKLFDVLLLMDAQSSTTYATWFNNERFGSCVEHCKNSLGNVVCNALSELAKTLLALKKRQPRLTPVQLFHHIQNDIGFIPSTLPEHQRAQAHYDLAVFEKLMTQVSHEDIIQPTVAEVLDVLSQLSNDKDLSLPNVAQADTQDAVELMTIFASKGLEYPVVFVANCDSKRSHKNDYPIVFDSQHPGKAGFGVFLSKNELKTGLQKTIWKTPRQDAEQKRLFYVALTRAQERLYVIRSPHRKEAWTEPECFQGDTVTLLNEATEEDAVENTLCPPDIQAGASPIKPVSKISEGTITSLAVAPQQETQLSLLNTNTQTNPASSAQQTNADVVPTAFSFSALTSFSRCPSLYWLKNKWRLPDPLAQETNQTNEPVAVSQTMTGSFIHGLIHKHYLHQGNLNAEKALAMMHDWAPTLKPDDFSHMYDLYQSFLNSDYTFTHLNAKQISIHPEKAIVFPWELNNKENESLFINVDGVLDLLLFDPEIQQHRLIDFKTNRDTLNTEQTYRYFEQLLLYRQGLLTLKPDMNLPEENIALVHIHADGVTTIPFNPDDFKTDTTAPVTTESMLSGLQERFSELAQCHHQAEFAKRPNSVSCYKPFKCAYLSICPQAEKRSAENATN